MIFIPTLYNSIDGKSEVNWNIYIYTKMHKKNNEIQTILLNKNVCNVELKTNNIFYIITKKNLSVL